MEDPILNKQATDFAELLGISQERAKELDANIDLAVKPGFSILAKFASTYLNRAKTFQEQLFVMTLMYSNLEDFIESTNIDPTVVLEDEIKFSSYEIDDDSDDLID